MIIIGLTGSIGMGKTTVAQCFRRLKIPVHDADQTAHRLMQPDGKAFPMIKAAFPQVTENTMINRKALADLVYADPVQKKKLEAILHPLIKQDREQFLKLCRKRRARLCVLDIPLLFETGRNRDVDVIVTVTAPLWIQKRRVLKRPGMTESRLSRILKSQMPDIKKRKASDHVITSVNGRHRVLNEVKRMTNEL